MKRKRFAAIATALILVSAGTAVALWIILSDPLEYDVVVEGMPITLEEVTGPTDPLARGVNHTFHCTATVNGGDWNSYFIVNITSDIITDDSLLGNFTVYMNDTTSGVVYDYGAPNTYQAHWPLGIISEGQVIEFYWTLYFDYGWPTGQYNILVYLDGEAA